jgi:glycosyltransferase involved in cell wall biosynthesis
MINDHKRKLMTNDDNRIRVTHIVPHLKQGGAEYAAVHLMTGLDPARFSASVIVLGTKSGSTLETTLDKSSVLVRYLGKKSGFYPRMFLRVSLALGKLQPAVIHTHVHVLRYVLPHLLFSRPWVAVHTVHNLAEWEVEPRAQWLQRLAFRSGVIPISVAREVAVSLHRRYQIEDGRVIPNCIPVRHYQLSLERREAWRRGAGIQASDIVFTCVALFREQKNHPRLLEAFRTGVGRNPSAKLLLVGKGPTELSARQLAESYGLGDQIRFLGMRDDVPEILGASDVFVLSSDYEGNPLAVMEAMAAGLPIVSTSVGGVPELVTDGRDGILVDPADEIGFKDSLQLLLDKPDVRKSMGLSAARTAGAKFDVRLMIQAYEALYQSLCDARLASPTLARSA